jgi:hypothetical protein
MTFPDASIATQRLIVGHEIALMSLLESIELTVQARGPAVGLADVAATPKIVPTAQSETDGHAMESAGASASTLLRCHAARPPVGWLELNTVGASRPSTARQNDTVGQEMRASGASATRCTLLQARAPAVGVVELSTLPESSTATHSATDGQDTLDKAAGPIALSAVSACTVCHAEAPPVGFVELETSPVSPTPTHSVAEGQDRAVGSSRRRAVARQAAAPPAGFVELST